MEDKSEDTRPNFIIRRTMQPEEAVQLLLQRFPWLRELGDSDAELIRFGPYYAYGVFAREANRRVEDSEFLQSLASFVDELAESADRLLEDLVVIEIFEEAAGHPLVRQKTCGNLYVYDLGV